MRGFALVLVCGVLALLLLAGVALAEAARAETARRAPAGAALRARWAAESGLEYAAARLSRLRHRPAARCDDWRTRPAFGRAEPWIDDVPLDADLLDNDADGLVDEPGEGDGIRSGGERWTDLDGDGTFSDWSGRLRGGGGALGLRFRLGIGSPEGRIPLNGGSLSAEDRFGTLPVGSNGVPDHRDVSVPYHRGIVHALNGLGALLHREAPSRFSTRCEEVEAGDPAGIDPGEPFQVSWLGHDLLSGRPAGGYRSPEEVRDAMREAGYRDGEWEAVEPFVGLGPDETPAEAGRPHSCDEGLPFPYAPVCAAAAPREVLTSLWTYLCAAPEERRVPGGEGGWGASLCTRTGREEGAAALRFKDLRMVPGLLTVLLYPDEAASLSDLLCAMRQEGPLSWGDLRRRMIREAPRLFARDARDLSGFPENAAGWVQAKADLAYQAVTLDPVGPPGAPHGAAAWASGGIDRDGEAEGIQLGSTVGYGLICRVKFPSRFTEPPRFPAPPWRNIYGQEDPYAPYKEHGDWIRPQGLSVAPPVLFDAASEGVSAGPGGTFRAALRARLRSAERLDFSSQEDFELLGGAPGLARRGIVASDPEPERRREVRTDRMGTATPVDDRTYPYVVTLPRFSRRACAGVPAALGPGLLGYARDCGAIALASREAGRLGAGLYWPFSEDFTPDISDNLLSEGIARHRCDAGLPFEPGVSPDAPALTSLKAAGRVEPFDCPGIPASGWIERMTVECWMGTDSCLELSRQGAEGIDQLSLASSRCGDATVFKLRVDWSSRVPGCRASTASFRIADAVSADGREGWDYHVAMLVERDPPRSSTRFRLRVNGRGADPEAGIELEHLHAPSDPRNPANRNGEMAAGRVALSLVSIDELRIYDRLLSDGEIAARRRKERFVRGRVSFVSPLYVLDAPATAGAAQWNGIVPPQLFVAEDPSDPAGSGPLRDGSGRPVPVEPSEALSVEIEAFADAAGTRPAGPPVPLPAAGPVYDLGSLGLPSLRAFRYRVWLDCRRAAGILDDTPVFESLWIEIRRQGRSPAWERWSASR